jgi:hypothetical protein
LLSAVLYPDTRYYSETGYKYFSTLKGINKADYDRLKPDLVIYQLKNGELLQADLAVFEQSKEGTHNACKVETECFIHRVSDLTQVEMPELAEPFQF